MRRGGGLDPGGIVADVEGGSGPRRTPAVIPCFALFPASNAAGSAVLATTLRKIRLYGIGLLGLRRDDVILASFPRSGSTWLRFILCNLLLLTEGDEPRGDGEVVDFPKLNATMPELGVSDLRKPWPFSLLPRIVKTHRPYLPLGRAERSILVLRDPRDVMVSCYAYEMGMTEPRFRGSFREFLRHRRFGLEAWFRHTRSWLEPAGHLIAYEDLRADPLASVLGALDSLDVEVERHRVETALERSRIDRVRRIEASSGVGKEGRFKDDFRFAGAGVSGGWQDRFSPEDLELYAELHARYRIDRYAP